MRFYTYVWFREDSTPYYVGKGSNGRAFTSSDHGVHRPKDLTRIQVQFWPDEATALAYERYQIEFWGRKDLGTGILRNRTDGGEGVSLKGSKHPQFGKSPSLETRNKIRKALLGRIMSSEWRMKIGEAHRGMKRSPEFCKKMQEVAKNRVLSQETRAKISESLFAFQKNRRAA